MLHNALLFFLVTTSQPTVDSDMDGIPDVGENLFGLDPEGDHDVDDVPNVIDPDDRGDGLPGDCVSIDGLECLRPSFEFDLDGDQVPSYLDLDSDADGWGDQVEGLADHDNDRVQDFLDVDSDGDGVLDVEDTCRIVIDPSQRDSDLDGVGDACEPAIGPMPHQSDDPSAGAGDGMEPGDEPGDDDEIDNLPGGVGGCNAGGGGGASGLVLVACAALLIRRRSGAGRSA